MHIIIVVVRFISCLMMTTISERKLMVVNIENASMWVHTLDHTYVHV